MNIEEMKQKIERQDAALKLALEALNWHYEACDRFVPLVSAQAITAIQELAK